jgi:hypothetical protein
MSLGYLLSPENVRFIDNGENRPLHLENPSLNTVQQSRIVHTQRRKNNVGQDGGIICLRQETELLNPNWVIGQKNHKSQELHEK